MADFLSEEWFELERSILADLDPRPGVNLDLVVKVAKGPDGDVTLHQQVVDGVLESAGFGSGPGDGATEVKASWEDAVAIATGEADPHVFYMQGRTKLSGDMHSLLIHLRPVTTSEPFTSRWADLLSPVSYTHLTLPTICSV